MGGDVFRYWRLKDIARGLKIIQAIAAWWGDNRHCVEEDIANEEARTCELEGVMIEFINTRLAPTTGRSWKAIVSPPTIALEKVLTNAEVEDILRDHIPGYGKEVHRVTFDSEYYLCSKQGVSMYLGWSAIDLIPYDPNRQDCDDFAAEVFGEFRRVYHFGNIGLAVDYSSRHAYSFAIFPDGDLWWIEPQSDRRIEIGSAPYLMERALLII